MDIWFEGLSLPVAELDRSIVFYASLGFAVEIRSERFGLLRFGTGTLGLLQLGDAAPAGRLRPFVQVEMGTDDLDVLYADFVERGIPVHARPATAASSGRCSCATRTASPSSSPKAPAGTTARGRSRDGRERGFAVIKPRSGRSRHCLR